MRSRERIIGSLESAFREAFSKAQESGDEARMAELDLSFQRDQIMLEVLLDLRQALLQPEEQADTNESSLLDKAKAIRNLTKLKMP